MSFLAAFDASPVTLLELALWWMVLSVIAAVFVGRELRTPEDQMRRIKPIEPGHKGRWR